MIYCKRVYEPAEPGDGYRVLVDRLWPRGVKKNALRMDLWCKDVAPSQALRRAFHASLLGYDDFRAAYCRELGANEAGWRPLASRAGKGNVTLLYAARDKVRNHAMILAAFLLSAG
ncbi:DUF488 domain-containing protein [Acerihabitans arboris]|uniref:DUF488 family protein n=1 Tax=Acerihabitans arboris TaxID=2691583 RepID=A0A845SQI1_9GAMM|nr:DUF488 family protein [Acerihabitans arboris]NDL63405.1 DUF488 family protein [Acerihabitans arboris]